MDKKKKKKTTGVMQLSSPVGIPNLGRKKKKEAANQGRQPPCILCRTIITVQALYRSRWSDNITSMGPEAISVVKSDLQAENQRGGKKQLLGYVMEEAPIDAGHGRGSWCYCAAHAPPRCCID